MNIGSTTGLANPANIERVATHMQVRNEPLGAIDLFDIEPNARLVSLNMTWDGLNQTECNALVAALGTLADYYKKITMTDLRGNSGGATDSEYVTLRPGSNIRVNYTQGVINTSGPIYYTVVADLLTYPHTAS